MSHGADAFFDVGILRGFFVRFCLFRILGLVARAGVDVLNRVESGAEGFGCGRVHRQCTTAEAQSSRQNHCQVSEHVIHNPLPLGHSHGDV